MFKKIIAPVQAWLLVQGKCVGCGRPLISGKKQQSKEDTEKVICQCGRIYIHTPKTGKYRRALFEEV